MHGQAIIKNSLSLSLVLRRERSTDLRHGLAAGRIGVVDFLCGEERTPRVTRASATLTSPEGQLVHIAGVYMLLKICVHQHAGQPAVDDVVGLAETQSCPLRCPRSTLLESI